MRPASAPLNETSASAGSTSAASEDQFVRETIQALRRKLLDLTSRNPLIDFKHSARSRRHLRIIDELPDQLFERLDSDSGMRFRSIGVERTEPADEQTVVFRRGLETAKLDDPEYHENLRLLGDDPGDKALQRLEDELRARVRERLGMPPRRPFEHASPADAAKALGIDPSLDLPAPSPPAAADAKPAPRHGDAFIQTLLYDTDMDRTLATINEHARLSITESGVNPLFCVIGFLEWYEDAASEVPLHAPLVLCPLTIEKEMVRGRYQYRVWATGEGAMLNVALAERLKRDFELELPPLGDENTPETYFAAVQRVIERQRAWKIRRWATLGLFSFARIAMYHDLDPKRWAQAGGIESHPGLRRIVAGGMNAATAPPVPEPSAPDPATADELDLPLIADADSSQTAAIRAALAGRDLVIEGPPGTGKSQTITNLIAAALAAGKSVLFLAEKMAALEVVKKRLEDADLGHFCLELHSTKAGRKEICESLKRRLEFEPRRSSESDLQSTLGSLGVARQHLEACVVALAEPAGVLGITVQELLWRCQRMRVRTPDAPPEIDELAFENGERLTETDLGRIALLGEQLERVRATITKSYGSLAQHPWQGIARADMDPFKAEDVVRRVRRLAEAAGTAEAITGAIAAATGWSAPRIDDLRLLGAVHSLAAPTAGAADEVIGKVADPQLLASMQEFVRERHEHDTLRAKAATAFLTPDAAARFSPEHATALAKLISEARFSDIPAGEVAAAAEQLRRDAETSAATARLMKELATRTGATDPQPPDAERAIVLAVELAAEAGPAGLAARSAALTAPGASDPLSRAADTIKSLREKRSALLASYAVDSVLDPAELRRHAAALRAAPALPFLSPRWWSAKAAFRGLCKSPVKAGRGAMAATLEEIALIHEGTAAINGDQALRTLLGSAVRGLDTDAEPALCIARWADRVRASLPPTSDAAVRMRALLLEGPADRCEALAVFAQQPRFANLSKAVRNDGDLTVADQAVVAHKRVDSACRAAENAAQYAISPQFRLAQMQGLATDIARIAALRESLDASSPAAGALGPHFRGHQTPVEPIEAAIAFVQAVQACAIPPELSFWILERDASQRLPQLKKFAQDAAAAHAQVVEALAELTGFTPVDLQTWLGTAQPLEVSARDLREHAARCANDPDGLQLLIDDARLVDDVRTECMGPLLDLYRDKRIPISNFAEACRRVIYQSIARGAISRSPALAAFTGERHESHRKQFRDLDRKLLRLRQTRIARDLSSREIDPGNDAGPRAAWTGRALIENEAAKQRRHIPVRDLLDRAGAAVQQLKPCFMMSPLSVAQYLKPGALKFDLIVMDEASQLRPEDAVGAVVRGSQVIIVGDPKQLPPTSFFMHSTPMEEDEGAATVADDQSILDAAMPVLRPVQRLKWHYRSRHGSLIAFSNKEFYNSELVVFPSPLHRHPDYGVRYEPVENGLCRGRVNLPEAQRVAEAVMRYAVEQPDRSLGVVTLNQPQAELLQLEIDRLAAETPEFEAWRKRRQETLEPFFVKNLENVQGDERDAVYISTVYGRDEAGNFYQRFGPINNEGGHRRLNVLFTRAKCQTVVFSSMDPKDIRAEETSKWGVRALKGYLAFAKNGMLEAALDAPRPLESDFEVSVADTLTKAGYEVAPRVGVVGYFIDLAVRHPDRSGEFAIGIECDGAMYHSAKSARDRDRLRQEVLERLNWRIHRIWSLDWYRRPREESDRLLKAVKLAIAGKP